MLAVDLKNNIYASNTLSQERVVGNENDGILLSSINRTLEAIYRAKIPFCKKYVSLPKVQVTNKLWSYEIQLPADLIYLQKDNVRDVPADSYQIYRYVTDTDFFKLTSGYVCTVISGSKLVFGNFVYTTDTWITYYGSEFVSYVDANGVTRRSRTIPNIDVLYNTESACNIELPDAILTLGVDAHFQLLFDTQLTPDVRNKRIEEFNTRLTQEGSIGSGTVISSGNRNFGGLLPGSDGRYSWGIPVDSDDNY